MEKLPSFWGRLRLVAWFKSIRKTNSRQGRRRNRVQRRTPFESLEARDLFAVVVDQNTSSILPDVAAIVINGSGFDPIVSNVTVTFNNGAFGTVTSATPTQLTVEFTTPPVEAGTLTAIVAVPLEDSGAPVQVATVVPIVTPGTASLAANATTLTIHGTGFDTTFANNTVVFTNGVTGAVTASTATTLTINITAPPTAAGSLSATVTTNGAASTTVQIATVVPVITTSSATLAANATSVVINGFGFDGVTAGNNVVDFDGAAVGTVSSATTTALTVTFTTPPKAAGSLKAIVTTNSRSSVGAAVEVATVTPVVTVSTSSLAANATTVTIQGFGFNTLAANNTVSFNKGAVGTVTAATNTSLSITFTTKPISAGLLTVQVTTSGVSSGTAVNAATVIPVVTSRTLNLAANAASVVINGFGFDTTIGNNTVSFNNGALGTVSAASATSLTVTLGTKPAAAGSLTAAVTTNTAASGANVQVATVTPVITSSTTVAPADDTTITIAGFGFSATAANNSIVFNNGAVGNITAATNTSLSVTFTTKPTVAGALTAVVTSNTFNSGSAVQVSSVKPVVTTSSTNWAANAATLTIAGVGFSTTLANNTVTFDNGAAGTVTAATATSLTVTISTTPTTAGDISASVTTNSVSSGTPVKVATVTPVITSSTANLAANAATIVINGFGFDSTIANNAVVFDKSATGTITAASPTSLTFTFTLKPASAGALTATVTTNTLASAANVQVATVVPVITSATTSLAANLTSVTINGFGFDTTNTNNLVAFDNGAVGTVATATATALTVTLSVKPTSAGDLHAVVTTNGVVSGAAVQVATVTPFVTSSVANLAANSPTLVIAGFGFDTTAGDNVVTLDDGAVGIVTSASPTALVVTFTTLPVEAGNMTASVSTDTLSSGTAVQVATVTPVVTPNTTSLLAVNGSSVIINGYGFDTTLANNAVTFDNGAIGSITAATNTSLTVNLTTKPLKAGTLKATVVTNTITSNTLATIASVSPVVTANPGAILPANATSVLIVGLGFDTTPANNTVVFDLGAAGSVSAATATTLTVTLSAMPMGGTLKAIVTTNSVANGTAVQVATAKPIVTITTTNIAADASTITINGFGFNNTAANNTVAFNNGAVGTVTAATPTALTVTFSTKPTSAGSLTAIVTSNGVVSGAAVQVGSVTPVVTSSTTSLLASATQIVINGFGFDPVPANNSVTFNNDATGTITGATATALTITFAKKPKTSGLLNASVTSNAKSSGAAVQVAAISPVVTANTSFELSADAATIVINGLGFDPTAANNTVVFNNDAVGTVTSATSSSITVTFSTKPTTAGSLTAIVTVGGADSGTAVQVATVAPVITTSSADLLADVTTLVINGFGFDPIAANNIVVFNDGAAGTVTDATATQLTVSLSTQPTSADSLTAIVTTGGVSSGTAVEVATVKPVITSIDTDLNANATTITINGFGFSAIAADNKVTFSTGVGTVTTASPTQLIVTFSTNPTTVGSLTASVISNALSSGTAVEVAKVIPVVTAITADLAANASTVTILGAGFDTTFANNTVVFNKGAIGTVASATATQLTVTLSTKPTSAGSLTAVVTTNTFSSSAPVQVATVTPVITTSSASLLANATEMTIAGFGFSTTAGDNLVTFDNNAVGTVTAATAIQLTVSFGTKPASAGDLKVRVTTNSVSSGTTAIKVATVTPVITLSTADLAANATSVVIAGFGFDPVAANNLVTLNNGAVGTVTTASATSLTVSFANKPAAGGSLTASVVSGGVSSGTAVQVSKVIPVVTANTALKVAADASTVVINGVGFDTTAASNLVTFNNGAVGTATSATATAITVTFSTKPTSAGSLTAIVTTNGAASAAALQIGTVTPVVTSATTTLGANASSVTIGGFGFSTTVGNNLVTFNNGAVGTVTTATATSLLVTFSTKPTSVGNLTAIVETNSVASGVAIQVATVKPLVTSSTNAMLINANTIVINGFGFDTTASQNTVTLNNGAVGTVTTATATVLTVTFTVKPTTVGNLTASVTTNGQSSGTAVQVAVVIPVVTSSSANRNANEATLLIYGFGFDTTAANNVVTFSSGTIGSVTTATSTMLTVNLTTLPKAGNLTAQVAVSSVSSGTAVQVGTVKPVITSNTASLGANATTLTIAGFGFDTLPANNVLTFNNGAVGTVTAATTTSMTVTFSTRATAMGSLTASVTTNSVTSGTGVQVATVAPVVTSSNANLLLTAPTLIINGFGFSTTPGNNTVTFNNGAVGSVTAATATALTVTFSTRPTAGNLTAVVTNNSVNSGAAIQVASVKPVVSVRTGTTLANAATLVINGSGFDTIAGNNTVVLNNGAVGTVTSATATALTVTFSTKAIAGNLTAIVTTNGVSSGAAIQVATITPVITSSTVSLALNGTRLIINGFGFDPVAANNSVTFNNSATGQIAAATNTSLTITLGVKPVAVGALNAVVTTNTRSSGSAVQVAQVVIASAIPVVTSSTATLTADSTTVTIAGTGFSTTAANNLVDFSSGAIGTVTASTATSLTVTFSTKPKAGVLTALVAANGVLNSGAIQVASVIPVVTSSTANQAAGLTTLTITGVGFDTTASSNTVTLSSGAIGNVTAATATSLTVTLSTRPTSTGSMTAIVTTNSKASASAVQVATVIPTVSSSTGALAINANTVVIAGFGFSTTAGNNVVTFNNGATGTVTTATANSLTVTFVDKPTAVDNLTAIVTIGSVNSGAAVQIASVKPVVTTSSSTLAANASTMTIAGFGFSTTPGNNTVTFNGGATGTVTAATATSLTVTFAIKPTTGNLTAIVTTSGVISGTALQVASVTPVVTLDTSNLAANLTTVTINGFGFSATPSQHLVTFNNSAVGTVTAATTTSLTVTFTTKPRSAGSLTAVVVSNGISSGAAVQIATVVPTITSSTTAQAVDANTVTINGFGFDPTAANNSVTMSNGAVGTVTTATATTLTVTFGTKPTSAGNLTASVTVNSVSSGAAVQIATVRPIITSSTASLALSATTLVINGLGFDTTAANNTVVFSNGAVGTVTSATATALTVTFSTTASAGNMTAVVTTNSASSGTAVQVARLTPTVTSSTANLAANASTMTIAGTGFSTTAASNTVTFNNGAVGTVTSATSTALTVTFSTKPTAAGSLTAIVTVGGVAHGAATQVATVIPVVTLRTSTDSIAANTIVINGFGFSATAANNTVVFNSGATGTVTTATATALTVTFGTKPTSVGNLTAIITTNSVSSGTAVQVATVGPVITSSTANLASTATTLEIVGTGFSTTAANNTVTFNNGGVGTVTAATATSLTVTFSTKPSAGSLTVVVTTSGASSGTAVQVARVVPAVTTSTANLATSATTLTIAGTGFSTTATNNLVTFNNGAVGTVTAATATSLTVTFSTKPAGGSLTASVSTNGVSSGTAVQVATVAPVVTANTVFASAAATTVTIAGSGFSTTPGNNIVTFNNGAAGTVTAATATSLTVTYTTKPTTSGSLTAILTTNGTSSGTAVQIATVRPAVTLSTSSLARTANTVVINGFGFSATAGNNTVVFNNGAVGTVTSATATSLTVTFSTKPLNVGSLTAVITSNSVSSGAAVQVAAMT